MSFMTTAEDCKYLLDHYTRAKKSITNKTNHYRRIKYYDKRINYYKEKHERLERLGL